MKHYVPKSAKVILTIFMLTFLIFIGCAGIQEKWNALTPDEKARVVLNDLQSQLNTLFDTGKAYITANPQYQNKWKTQIVPAFDVANKSLASAMTLAKSGQLTPDQVYAQVQPVINSVINLLVSIGAAKKTQLLPDELILPIKPMTAAMDAMLILALINGLVSLAMQLWSSARKVFGTEAIPSWDEILAKNKALQDKIDAEMQP
jgi:hypothetical protein